MDIAAPIIFTVLLFGGLWLLSRFSKPPQRVTVPSFSPVNELEHLLVECINRGKVTTEIREFLSSTVLLALETPEEQDIPMTFSAALPAEIADNPEDHNLTEDGKILFGPWVVCFSSEKMVKGLSTVPFLGDLVLQGNVREFKAREILQSAIDQQFDVILNPFYRATLHINQDELIKIIELT